MAVKIPKEIARLCHSRAQMYIKSTFSFVLYGIILSYIMKMERSCDHCSRGWMRDTLKNGAVVFLIIAVLGLIPGICEVLNDNIIVASVIGFAKIAYLIVLIAFVWRLKRGQCQGCSDDWRRLGIEVYAYIVFAMLLLAILYPFVVLAMYTACGIKPKK